MYNISEIEEASRFIDTSALAITNMKQNVEDLVSTANSLKTIQLT